MRRSDEEGASALEYGLMIAAIAGTLVAVVFALGPALDDSLDNDRACFANQLNSMPC